MSKIGIPQALPPPVDFFKTFTPSINKIKTSKPSISNPKPIALDFFNKVSARSMNSSAKKQTPIIANVIIEYKNHITNWVFSRVFNHSTTFFISFF